jgi:hypothetical protein
VAVRFWPPLPSWFRFTFDSAGAVKMAHLLGLDPLRTGCLEPFKEDRASYNRAFNDAGLASKVMWLFKGVRTLVIV